MKLLVARISLFAAWVLLCVAAEMCAPAAAQAAAVPGYATNLTVTAYCLQGRTSTGVWARPGTVAAQGAAPTFTALYVPGYGWGVVEDTGPLAPNQLDIWMESCSAAMVWGRRTVRVWVLQP